MAKSTGVVAGPTTRAALALLVAASLAAFAGAARASVEPPKTWALYQNQRYGFTLSYPADLLVEARDGENGDGRMWSSADGRIRLIAGAVQNADRQTLESYREFIMTDVYAGARFDYTPVRKSWFVVSGTKDGEMFYERVTFACAGRVIYAWQLFYPAETRGVLDKVVEQIHRSFRLGRGEDGQCPSAP